MPLSELMVWVKEVPPSLPEDLRPMEESICESFEDVAKRLMDLGLGYLAHDTQILSESDWFIEMGPVAGAGGGYVVAQGSVEDPEGNDRSVIGPFLSGRDSVRVRNRAGRDTMNGSDQPGCEPGYRGLRGRENCPAEIGGS